MTGPSRRDTLAIALAALLPSPAQAKETTSLAALAKRADLLFGAAVGAEIFADPPYGDLVLAQSAILTPDTALKFDYLQPEQGKFNFPPADRLVDAARAHGLLVRGHNLFWNDWPPAWLPKLSHREIARVFDATLDVVVPHFAGRLQSWDVVNEPFHLGKDRPGTFRVGAWYDAMGPDYIYRAFRRVPELDPHARLVLNEAWTERADPVGLAVRRALLELVDRMQDKGLKLDAIGLESHLFPDVAWDPSSFADFLHAIAERKLDIYITELDVDDASFSADVDECDAKAAAWTSGYLQAALAVPAVKIVQTWGLADRYTWYRNEAPMQEAGYDHLPRPLPWDDTLRAKPMREAIAAAFHGRATAGGTR